LSFFSQTTTKKEHQQQQQRQQQKKMSDTFSTFDDFESKSKGRIEILKMNFFLS